jgi:hypothetical protein
MRQGRGVQQIPMQRPMGIRSDPCGRGRRRYAGAPIDAPVSCTRIYSRHSGGFLANSKFSQTRRASMRQLPHFVFIFLTPHSAASTPIMGCHFASSGGMRRFSCARYHSFKINSPLFAACAGVDGEDQAAVVFDDDFLPPAALHNVQQIAAAPKVMAFARHHFALRLARLGGKERPAVS